VLYNYLSNALKFTPERGRVEIRIRPEDRASFRLEFEDTGVGIKPEDIGRLFIEFQQLDAALTKKHPGTGLGLALTKRLVEAQGGSVGVRSVLGEGSVFHAILPRGLLDRLAPPIQWLPDGSAKAASVLVIMDDVHDQTLIARVLLEGGYRVDVARSGAEALQKLEAGSFQAVALDLLLPDMNGFELLKQLRLAAKTATIPILVVTVGKDTSQVSGFSVQDVLTKPIADEAVLESLRRVGLSGGTAGYVLVVDDDLASLQLMQATLEGLGYRVLCESSAPGALAALDRDLPLAIILDLMMPEMSGFELLERVRGNARAGRVPVIVWTAKELTLAERVLLRERADGVMYKIGSGAGTLLQELGQAFRKVPLLEGSSAP
jgi:CheY-like chemotaxis protein